MRFNSNRQGINSEPAKDQIERYKNKYGETPDWVDNFWSMEEAQYGHRSFILTDVIKGLQIETPDVDLEQSFTNAPIAPENNIVCPQGVYTPVGRKPRDHFPGFYQRDWIVVTAATIDDNGGNIEMTIGVRDIDEADQVLLKLQPYYTAIEVTDLNGLESPFNFLQAPYTFSNQIRTPGTNMMVAHTCTEGVLRTWVDGVVVSTSASIESIRNEFGGIYDVEMRQKYKKLIEMCPTNRFRLGHSAHTAITTFNVNPGINDLDHFAFQLSGTLVEVPGSFSGGGGDGGDLNSYTNYAGLLLGSWEQGSMPTDIGGLLDHLKTEWFNGNKTTQYTFT